MQILNEYGGGAKTYFWYAAGEMGDEEGWYDVETYADRPEDVITKGQSFLINNDNGTYAVQFSGEVAEASETIPCDQGFTMIGNYSAQVKSIQDFRIAAGEDGDVEGDGSESMQFLNSLGGGAKTYFWYAAGEMGDEEGWYDVERYADGEDDVIQPGEGFMYNNDNGTSVMTIPGTVITK